MSERFGKLVSSAEVLLPELPWPQEFEKDKMCRPLSMPEQASAEVYFELYIFGHDAQDAEDVVYINWLSMVRAGLLGLEFYTPESKSWRQARFVILRVLLEAGEGLVGLEEVTGQDGKPDARITLDRSKIGTVGKNAIHRFLCKLQVRPVMRHTQQLYYTPFVIHVFKFIGN
ncbi:bifunctional diacylglycerol diphosphate phosphatase/phosphatidate phosphatase [Xenoophorus captivus]|uniref:Bifunctional diacylglycerol diphosphate phosphatase/phosphatidate phosphatase n=1 Tax=Xenoophorus captivus TaxID=1517983 RepID=A0ABV0QAD3_9TELE